MKEFAIITSGDVHIFDSLQGAYDWWRQQPADEAGQVLCFDAAWGEYVNYFAIGGSDGMWQEGGDQDG